MKEFIWMDVRSLDDLARFRFPEDIQLLLDSTMSLEDAKKLHKVSKEHKMPALAESSSPLPPLE